MQCTQYIAIKLFFATRLLCHFAWYIGFGARGVGGGGGGGGGEGVLPEELGGACGTLPKTLLPKWWNKKAGQSYSLAKR